MADDRQQFDTRNQEYIARMGADNDLQAMSNDWMKQTFDYEYSYHFRWMGLPIIQYPQDMVAMQEIIWQVKPDLIIETGIARGGSLIFYASMLHMMDIEGDVVGIDIDIRQHNREAIESHPMYRYITMLEGSSIDETIVEKVRQLAVGKKRVVVALDSLHTHGHVLKELELYSPFVTQDSYLIVFDTIVENLPDGYFDNRPWDKGDNPKTALTEFLGTTDRFQVEQQITDKLLITVAPGGYLRCVNASS